MYDNNKEPQIGQALPNDPHQVIDQIAYCDAQIEDLRNSRLQLVNHYQNIMQGYEKHYHEVQSRSEPTEVPVPMPMQTSPGRW